MTPLYAERICRIESEISQALQARSSSHLPTQVADIDSVLAKPDSVLVYSPRASHA